MARRARLERRELTGERAGVREAGPCSRRDPERTSSTAELALADVVAPREGT